MLEEALDRMAGVKLRPVVEEIRSKGGVTSYRGLANALNLRGIKTVTGRKFRGQTVINLLGAT